MQRSAGRLPRRSGLRHRRRAFPQVVARRFCTARPARKSIPGASARRDPAELRRARTARDAIAEEWDEALGALRRGARVAADEGATNLHSILFGSIDRPRKRVKGETDDTPPPADDQAAA